MTPELYYPYAVQHPLKNHSRSGLVADKNTIILHITGGSTAAGAIAWFEQSTGKAAVSAHFVIDRDGTIFQLLPISDVAWHASQANSHSIGIEHAAVVEKQPCTPEQYAASATLLVWLCAQLGIPCDRNHIRTHNEASPRDGHTLCCTGGLDPDKVVAIAVSNIGQEKESANT